MHPIIIGRLVFGGLGLIFSLIFFALLAAVAAAAPTDTELPPDFSLQVGHHSLFATPASGDNVYQCVVTANGYAWRLSGVYAKLLDSDGHLFATQNDIGSFLAIDGGEISGRVVKTIDAGAENGDALYAVASSTGGAFSRITDVVRYHVVGGQPPAQVCDQSALHQTQRVPFKADYAFFEAES
jgi:hypothetical protein